MEHFVTKQMFERLDMIKTFQTGKKKKKKGWQWLNPSPPSMTFHYLFRDKTFCNSDIFQETWPKKTWNEGHFERTQKPGDRVAQNVRDSAQPQNSKLLIDS